MSKKIKPSSALPLFDRTASTRERDRGIRDEKSVNSDWIARCLDHLVALKGTTPEGFTGEDIRAKVIEACGFPSHPNAFGALTMQAVRKKIIVPTGQWVPMKDRSSHARKTPTYKWGEGKAHG